MYNYDPSDNTVEYSGKPNPTLSLGIRNMDDDCVYLVVANSDVITWSKPYLSWQYLPKFSPSGDQKSSENPPGADNGGTIDSNTGEIDHYDTMKSDVSKINPTDADSSADAGVGGSSGGCYSAGSGSSNSSNSWFLLIIFVGFAWIYMRLVARHNQ